MASFCVPTDLPSHPPPSPLPPAVVERDPLSALKEKFARSEIDLGLYLWQAASSGSTETLELILQLPNAKEKINYVPKGKQLSPLMAATKAGSLDCVKILLYHGANLYYKYSNVMTPSVRVWHVAKRMNHTILEQYLKYCESDIQTCGLSRAYLELTLTTILSNHHCTPEEIVHFFDCLRNLVNNCHFDVNQTVDEENKNFQPLLLRAANVDNYIIATRLLSEFHANYSICDPSTGENVLHVCFKNTSNLRFHFVLQYPALLRQGDKEGNLPLFIACMKDDVVFFKWLLKKARSRINVAADTPTMVLPTGFGRGFRTTSKGEIGLRQEVRLSRFYDHDFTGEDLEELDVPPSPSTADLLSMQPFAAGKDGRSVLHVLAERGSTTILSLITQVCLHVEGFDFSVLTRRHGSLLLPIEKALITKDVACLNILTDLTIRSYQLHILLEDTNVLKNAVVTKNIASVMALIKFGFHSGIELAITLAASYELHEMMRLLLFWKVEIQTYYEFSHKQDVQQFFSASSLQWKQLELCSVDPSWIYDAISAMNIAVSILNEFSKAHSFKENNAVIFQELGDGCVEYFEKRSVSCSLPFSLTGKGFTTIVSVNLSENHLEELPSELFQLVALTSLDLKYNKIKSLPEFGDYMASNIHKAKLETLCLDYNQLEHLPDELIYCFANSLMCLSVQNNRLLDLPTGLWVMPKLSILKLASNKLSSLHYLSEPQFYEDVKFMKKISQFEVRTDGSVQPPKDLSPTIAGALIQHFKHLAALLYTICAIYFPHLDLSGRGVLFGELIQLYHQKCFQHANFVDGAVSLDMSPTGPLAATLGEEITSSSSLAFLDLSFNKFKNFPWDLPCLAPKLVKLDMTSNMVKGLDIIQDLPKAVNNVTLKCNKISSVCQVRSTDLPCGFPVGLLAFGKSTTAADSYCKHTQHKILDKLTRLILDNNLLDYCPVLKRPRASSTLAYEFHAQVNPLFPDLAIFSIASNRFITVPKYLHHIKHLSSLNLSHNNIQELPEELGLLNTDYITLIKLDGIIPKNIPDYVLKSSARKLVKYLRDLKQRAKPFRSIKLMFVGQANKGKTSLLLNLTKKGKMIHYSRIDIGKNEKPLSTVGVELGEYIYSPHANKPLITFMTWDFGGQEEYYATHQCFLTKRSLYLLLWNIKDGEEGVKMLRPWLENIACCAPTSPVMIIGSHLDQAFPNSTREKDRTLRYLEARIKEMYFNESTGAYPAISEKIYFMDVHNERHVDKLRDDIYNFVTNFVPMQNRRKSDSTGAVALLERKVPESYVQLRDFVRGLAERFRRTDTHPVLTKSELIQELSSAGYSFEEEFEQVSSFLHENGSLLHFEDSSLLNDLYFVDPQWLCKMVAKIITIGQINPYFNKGFMWMKDVTRIFSSYATEFTNLLRKFEVVYQIDERRILIPSLLPDGEEDACNVYSKEFADFLAEREDLVYSDSEGYESLGQLDWQIYCRYYLLPFVPSGFFARFIARLTTSDIIDQLQQSLKSDFLGTSHVASNVHWSCWGSGIVLVWNRKEIFRVAPLLYTNTSGTKIMKFTKPDCYEVCDSPDGLEIKVAVLPEHKIRSCVFLEPALQRMSKRSDDIYTNLNNPSQGKCIASWLLHKTTSIIDSIFQDWYNGFGSEEFDDDTSSTMMANYCTQCLSSVHQSYSEVISTLYMFTSLYCCLATCRGEQLECPTHGKLNVEDVAPDLAFGDFHPASLFTDTSAFDIKTLFPLGSGGFGTVHKAVFQRKPLSSSVPVQIALKKINGHNFMFLDDKDIAGQLNAWSMYCNASIEARVMNQLSHKNILGLLGIYLQDRNQISMLIELAPKGDLKSVVNEFKTEGMRLSRRTIKATLIQVASAMEYLHSLNIIYRDLKPQNILVWKFPQLKAQWNADAKVHVKVADYGISSLIGHQSITGNIGTESYKAPEVVMFSGRKAYSFEVDVYSFGMVIYFLVSQQHPFSDSHVSVSLSEGRRPGIPKKLHPRSVRVKELMCWCWCDLPQERPNFTQILSILKDVSFTNLIATAEVQESTKKGEQITAACLDTVIAEQIKDSMQKEVCPSMSRMMSLMQSKASWQGEHAVQLFYGTDQGQCGMMRFQATGAIKKVIELPTRSKKFVSCILLINGRIWISTVGSGLFVYNSNTLQYEGSWGDKDKEEVYNLLHIVETSCVVALTSRGLFSFEAEITNTCFFDSLEFTNCVKENFGGSTMSVGVVVHPDLNIKQCELWVCSQAEMRIFILNPLTLDVMQEVEYSQKEYAAMKPVPSHFHSLSLKHSRSRQDLPMSPMVTIIKDMKVVPVGYSLKVGVADNWMLTLWDVENRMLEKTFNCADYCQESISDTISPSSARITSLTSKGDMFYAGLDSGCILCIHSKDMSATLVLKAYDRAVYSLLVMKPPKQTSNQATTKMKTVYHTQRQMRTPPKQLPLKKLSPNSRRKDFHSVRKKPRHYSIELSPLALAVNSVHKTPENLLLISIGTGYKGVVGPHANHPKHFILPSVSTLQCNFWPAKPEVSSSHLLVWSTEKCGEEDDGGKEETYDPGKDED